MGVYRLWDLLRALGFTVTEDIRLLIEADGAISIDVGVPFYRVSMLAGGGATGNANGAVMLAAWVNKLLEKIGRPERVVGAGRRRPRGPLRPLLPRAPRPSP